MSNIEKNQQNAQKLHEAVNAYMLFIMKAFPSQAVTEKYISEKLNVQKSAAREWFHKAKKEYEKKYKQFVKSNNVTQSNVLNSDEFDAVDGGPLHPDGEQAAGFAEHSDSKTEKIKYDEQKDRATLDVISPDPARIKDLDALLAAANVDLTKWFVKRHTINKWEVGAKDADGNIVVEPLFQIKAYLELIPNGHLTKKVIEFFKEEINKEPKQFKQFKQFKSGTTPSKNGFCLEISCPDLHIGKMSWPEETGEDYSTKEAVRRLDLAIADICNKAPLHNVSNILLPIGNDFFNSNNEATTTARGTPQADDSRWIKTFREGCRVLIDNIESLANMNKIVDVVIVQGNHDWEKSFYLGEFLSAYFRNHPFVNINNKATPRKYFVFGKNLIGFTHGDKEKMTDLPLIMASESKEWSDCPYREIHLGHLHKEGLKEVNGVKVRVLPSLASTDAWHKQKGYVGNRKSAMGFLYDQEEGLVANFYSYADYNKA